MNVESATVEAIPVSERHGRPRDLTWMWFSVNMMPLTLTTGVLAPTVYGLPLGWSLVAVVLGNLVGSLFMALHSAQGPDMGIPQMIQSRAQFGSYGSILILVVVIVATLGFCASIVVLGGQSLHQLIGGVSVNAGIVVCTLLAWVIVLFGYDVFHRFNRYIVGITGLAVVLAFVWLLLVNGPLPHEVRGLSFDFGRFLGAMSVAVTWQIAYAPYVSDYSRYMHPRYKSSVSFWTTYGGTVVGAAVVMVLGVLVGVASTNADSIAGVAGLAHGIAGLLMFAFVLGAIDAAAINIYTPMLSAVTVGQTMKASWLPRFGARLVISSTIFVLVVLAATLGKDNFLTHYNEFIVVLLYLLSPWTAINLVDFYLLRRGSYDVPSILRSDGGVYGRWIPVGVACYVIGFIIQIPFMNVTFYESPVARALGGADISWIIGIGVTAPLYYLWQRGRPEPAIVPAAAAVAEPSPVGSAS